MAGLSGDDPGGRRLGRGRAGWGWLVLRSTFMAMVAQTGRGVNDDPVCRRSPAGRPNPFGDGGRRHRSPRRPFGDGRVLGSVTVRRRW
jgi:hypothetical protein